MDLSLLLPVIGFIFTVVSKLLLLYSTIDKTSPFEDLGCFSECLMSFGSIQKLFCGIYSAFKCSFDDFVGEKVFSLSYSSAILAPSLKAEFFENFLSYTTKVHIVKVMVFPVFTCSCESWTIMKAECQSINAFQLWCWRRLWRIPWTARRSNQSISKEIIPEYSLKGLILKLQYFGQLM